MKHFSSRFLFYINPLVCQDLSMKFHVMSLYGPMTRSVHSYMRLPDTVPSADILFVSSYQACSTFCRHVSCILIPNLYCFTIVHQFQVMQAPSRLIPDNMRESFHLLIGTQLLMNTPESELETAIFDVLVHMNKGIRLIQTQEQKYEVI